MGQGHETINDQGHEIIKFGGQEVNGQGHMML